VCELVRAMHECNLIVIRTFGLRRGIAHRDTAPRDGARVVVVARARVVCADTFAAGTAEELRDRLVRGLPEDVPQSDVDHRRRAYFRAAAREAEVARHQMAVVRLDLQRILAQEIRRSELVQLRFHSGCAARCFAEPDQSCIGVDLREQEIGALWQSNGFNRSDFHVARRGL
jgi:hypothetical protein